MVWKARDGRWTTTTSLAYRAAEAVWREEGSRGPSAGALAAAVALRSALEAGLREALREEGVDALEVALSTVWAVFHRMAQLDGSAPREWP